MFHGYLFTEDVTFDLREIGLPCFDGYHGLRQFFSDVFDNMSHHAHYAHYGTNVAVRHLDADTASVWAYVIGMKVRDGVQVTLHVKYFLDYVRTPAGWTISRFSEVPILPMSDSLTQVHRSH